MASPSCNKCCQIALSIKSEINPLVPGIFLECLWSLYTKLSTRCIVSFLYLNVRATSSELVDFEVLLKPNLFASLKFSVIVSLSEGKLLLTVASVSGMLSIVSLGVSSSSSSSSNTDSKSPVGFFGSVAKFQNEQY